MTEPEDISEPQLSLILRIQELKNLSKEVQCLYFLLFNTNDSLGKVRPELREELQPLRDKLQILYDEYILKVAAMVDLLEDDFD